MGKFVKKGKITRHVSLTESPQSQSQSQSQSPLGVRTRAKTKILAALQQSHEFCYLQLRSRRLQKPRLPPPSPPVKTKTGPRQRNPVQRGPGSRKGEVKEDAFGVEASFRENDLEIDGIGRSTRESTPCGLIRDAGSIGTPGSAARSTCSGAVNQRRVQDPVQRSVPSTREMEQFFGNDAREQQQFMDKYNFDIHKDLPLPGRFEWVRIDP